MSLEFISNLGPPGPELGRRFQFVGSQIGFDARAAVQFIGFPQKLVALGAFSELRGALAQLRRRRRLRRKDVRFPKSSLHDLPLLQCDAKLETKEETDRVTPVIIREAQIPKNKLS